MNPELLYKYLENTVTDDELKQVLDWLDADAAHQQELNELDKVLAASVIYGAGVLPQEAVVKTRKGFSLRRIVRYAVQTAAVLAIGGGFAWMLSEYRLGEWSQKMTTLEVPAGHFITMTLQDGTTVWLNSDSKIEYPLVFAGGERRVKVSGEAMFDVEHDPRHPFVVETFACDVEVLGTKFDVVAEEQDNLFSTALLRGSVKVSSRLTPGEELIIKPNEEVRLMGNRLIVEPINNPDEYLWTQGMISIKGLEFPELMAKFERCFGVEILIECEQMPTINYNHGKFRISDGIDSALHLLQMSANFTYTRNVDNGVIIIR